MPMRPCGTPGCPSYATAKGMCDFHRREKERERSTERRGGYTRGPYANAVAARDADEGYSYPKRGNGRKTAQPDARDADKRAA